jgi:DNA polymerase III subunit gamma/tau
VRLLVEVETQVRLARYSPGRIEFQPTDDAPPDLAARLSHRLQGWTGARWGVSVVSSGGGATVAEERDAERTRAHAEVRRNPLVSAVFETFPDARIVDIRDLTQEAAVQALAEVEDEWDPFEEG